MQHSCLSPTVLGLSWWSDRICLLIASVNPMGTDIFRERTLFEKEEKEEEAYTLGVQISIVSFRTLH